MASPVFPGNDASGNTQKAGHKPGKDLYLVNQNFVAADRQVVGEMTRLMANLNAWGELELAHGRMSYTLHGLNEYAQRSISLSHPVCPSTGSWSRHTLPPGRITLEDMGNFVHFEHRVAPPTSYKRVTQVAAAAWDLLLLSTADPDGERPGLSSLHFDPDRSRLVTTDAYRLHTVPVRLDITTSSPPFNIPYWAAEFVAGNGPVTVSTIEVADSVERVVLESSTTEQALTAVAYAFDFAYPDYAQLIPPRDSLSKLVSTPDPQGLMNWLSEKCEEYDKLMAASEAVDRLHFEPHTGAFFHIGGRKKRGGFKEVDVSRPVTVDPHYFNDLLAGHSGQTITLTAPANPGHPISLVTCDGTERLLMPIRISSGSKAEVAA